MTDTIDRSGCPRVFDAGLPPVDYLSALHPDEAHDIIRQVRQRSPIALGAFGPEVLSYDLVRTILRDDRFRIPEGMFLAAQGITSGPLWERVATNLISLDGEEHHRLRRLICTAFTPRAVERMRSTAAQVINDLLDQQMPQGHCDVVADIARSYPIPVICGLLGAPPQDWPLFSDWADDILKAFNWNAAADTPVILAAWAELDAYIDEMVAHRRHTLTDDLLSELIRIEDDGDRLTADELRMLVAGLLLAGTDTTRNQLAASLHMLLDHPDQWALLTGDPGLVGQAVEETLRYAPIAASTVRVAVADAELAGVVIPAGTIVLVNLAAANRDPARYPDPERLDITRVGAAPIQTFGGGTHYCLGNHLARLELTEALTVLARRIPNARRSGPAPWKPVTAITGPTCLPIEFDARP